MIATGAPVTEVQHQLGHSNPSITLGIYSHWFKNSEGGGAVNVLARAVLGSPSTPVSERAGEWALSGHSEAPESVRHLAPA